MTKKSELIVLFDLDGTLCDYDKHLEKCMEELRSPEEPYYAWFPKDEIPIYFKRRADLIRSSAEWWVNIPKFQLGFDVWGMVTKLKFRRMVLTQGPKRNPASWSGKKMWIDKNLGQDVDITITRDKGLVYGKVLVDDWPEYIKRWLEWRPRGLVIMPAHDHNKDFSHPQVIRYTGKNKSEVFQALTAIKKDQN